MQDLLVTSQVVLPAAELSWSAVRSSGPGGQNVNKVASKVELRFALAASTVLSPAVKARLRNLVPNRITQEGDLLLVSQVTRDQPRNLEDARSRLADLVRLALVPPRPRRATRPTRGSIERRISDKRHQSSRKASRRSDSGD
jgi:ribosome-associated protein